MLETRKISCDLCVVGGGLSGICAAISAARHGAKVVIMHERPMFGGNASSEIRMWISGAKKDSNETGIVEEIELENLYRNPTKNYYIWDTVLFEMVKREKNITYLLNCTCIDAVTEKGEFSDGRDIRIRSVKGYQMTTQRFFEVEADLFADCSGDSILAPLTGAKYMLGRESREVFGENTHVKESDLLTMGMSCLVYGRETDEKVKFTLPDSISPMPEESFKYRTPNMKSEWENFWYLELGGNRDSIGDTEELRDELVELALGTWNFIKNSGKYECDTYDIDFLGFLPGKRESRRMTGEIVVTGTDILSDRKFEDTVAFGGWPIDDHFPDGFYYKGTPNTDFHTPVPYCIPYRCLYSANVENLFFAGRNISVSHMALSSMRVMKTCALMGQAVGTAAAIALKYKLTPHGVYLGKLSLLQQTLMNDDSFIPNKLRNRSDMCRKENMFGVVSEKLCDGIDRVNNVYGNISCGETVENGKPFGYKLGEPAKICGIHIVFDSDLERKTLPGGWCEQLHATRANVPKNAPQFYPPKTLCRSFTLSVTDENGVCEKLHFENNRKRSIDLAMDKKITEIALTVESNWGGSDKTNVFSFDFR